jgi:hypothetical protein
MKTPEILKWTGSFLFIVIPLFLTFWAIVNTILHARQPECVCPSVCSEGTKAPTVFELPTGVGEESLRAREDIVQMLEYAKAAEPNIPTTFTRITEHYHQYFMQAMNEKRGDPFFKWTVPYHTLDMDGGILRTYVNNHNCVWRIEDIYVGALSAAFKVSPKSLEEVKKC